MASILIIDDDDIFRSTLGATLATAGHEVALAANGFDGANAYRAKPADLVLVDMVMPHSGLALIQVLRSQFPNLKVIAMSGGSPRRLRHARELGAYRTLAKPFSPEELATAIADTLAANPAPPTP
jgi:DNA-binding NtrC family response regulator